MDTRIPGIEGRGYPENPWLAWHTFGTPRKGGPNMLKTGKFKWWPGTGSNRRRQPFQGCALPLSYLAVLETSLRGRETSSIPGSPSFSSLPLRFLAQPGCNAGVVPLHYCLKSRVSCTVRKSLVITDGGLLPPLRHPATLQTPPLKAPG